jgi:hypothetical protein
VGEEEETPALTLHTQPESMLQDIQRRKPEIQWCDFTPKLSDLNAPTLMIADELV